MKIGAIDEFCSFGAEKKHFTNVPSCLSGKVCLCGTRELCFCVTFHFHVLFPLHFKFVFLI